MPKGYFSGDAQVLLANGSYKNIAHLKSDDLVLNMKNQAVKVTKIHQASKLPMMGFRYQNWYTPFYCTPTLHFLSEGTWVAGGDLKKDICLTENNIHDLLPEEFNIPSALAMLKPSYELGLIFGLYAGYGGIVNNEIVFRFGPNEMLVAQVAELFEKLFAVAAVFEKDDSCYQVKISSAALVELFSEFGSKITRTIPVRYWSSNEDYARGLFEGLIEYDPDNNVSHYIPITKSMAEVFSWVSSLLGMTFENGTPRVDKLAGVLQIYPLVVKHEQDHVRNGKVTSVDTDVNLELSGWNLEVACPTNSFIVNNLVVRSAA